MTKGAQPDLFDHSGSLPYSNATTSLDAALAAGGSKAKVQAQKFDRWALARRRHGTTEKEMRPNFPTETKAVTRWLSEAVWMYQTMIPMGTTRDKGEVKIHRDWATPEERQKHAFAAAAFWADPRRAGTKRAVAAAKEAAKRSEEDGRR